MNKAHLVKVDRLIKNTVLLFTYKHTNISLNNSVLFNIKKFKKKPSHILHKNNKLIKIKSHAI